MPNHPKRVFISYARKDGVELALRLRADLQTNGYDVWLDTARTHTGASWTAEIEKAIDNCDVAIALLTPGSYISEVCRAEQLRALRRQKVVIPVLGAAGAEVPLHLESKNYRDFTGAKAHDVQLKLLIEDIRTSRNAVALQERFRTTYLTAPPLPRNYIVRSQALENLRNAVMADNSGPSIALTALSGMGGIGKTILAQALSRDEVVQQAFPDGIAWSTVGKDAAHTLTTRMQEVRRALGDEPTKEETELQCINRYRTLLANKAALVIVDDIWRIDDIEPFLAESPRSRVLFTTRDRGIVAAVGADEHTLDLLTAEQSLALLARWAGCAVETLPAEAGALVRESGRLPLALSMIGSTLRGRPQHRWRDILQALRHGDLEKVPIPLADYRYPSLAVAIQASVTLLDSEGRKHFADLAVFPEDTIIPRREAIGLWGMPESEAERLLSRLLAMSLVQIDSDDNIVLHDLVRDYLKGQLADPAAAHSRLVDSWGDLHKLPSLYAWRWVAYHLASARRTADLRALLLDFDWIRAKVRALDLTALLADYDLLAGDPDFERIQGALQLAAHILAEDRRPLREQLPHRLLSLNSAPVAKVREWAMQRSNISSRASVDVQPSLPILDTGLGDFDVFLCHNSDDKPAVRQVALLLKEHSLTPWLDEWELRPGFPWQRLLEDQIAHTRAAAVFVGKNGIGPWQNEELDAFIREFVRRKCPVIPVILSECLTPPQLPLFLGGRTWVDFRKKDPDPMASLIWGITGKRTG